MKSGTGSSRRGLLATFPNDGREEVRLYRTGKLGLTVRVPGRRLPKSTVQQLFGRASTETRRADH